MDPYVFTPPPTPPSTNDPTNFDVRADALVAWLVTMVTEHQAFANQLAPLFGQLAQAAEPGGITLTYTFDGASASIADPGAGKLRLNNLTQASATAVLADNLDNIGTSATGRLALLTSTSTIKGTVYIRAALDPSRWLLGLASANTAASGYYNITIGSVLVSSANPFTHGEELVVTLIPKGDKGDTGLTGATSLWTTDQTLNPSGQNVVTIALPTGAATCRFRLENLGLSTSQTVTLAFSTNGSTFGSQTSFDPSNVSNYSGTITFEGLGRDILDFRGMLDSSGVPTSPDARSIGNLFQGYAKVTGGATHVRLTGNAGATMTGTIIVEKK